MDDSVSVLSGLAIFGGSLIFLFFLGGGGVVFLGGGGVRYFGGGGGSLLWRGRGISDGKNACMTISDIF